MLASVLRRIKNPGGVDEPYGLFGGMDLRGDSSEIQNTFVPNEIDDAEEQIITIVQENRLDRGLIHTTPNVETLDLKDYIDRVDWKENLKADNLDNDLDENEDKTKDSSKTLNQTSLESYSKASVHNDINFNFSKFYKH